MMNDTPFYNKLCTFPEGASEVWYQNRRYLLRKSTELKGKLIKIYAKELGGNDFISGNYYVSLSNGILKPCEMPHKKVIDFILEARLLTA